MTTPDYASLLAHIDHLIATATYSHCYLFVGTVPTTLPDLGVALAAAFTDNSERTRQRVAAGNHPDVHWLTPEKDQKSVKIQRVREVTTALTRAPAEADCHVLVIPEIAQLTLSAANGLLKTIEEPVGRQITLMFAARQNDVLPTLQSRAQVVALPAAEAVDEADWFAAGQRILLKWSELWLFQRLEAMTYLATTLVPFFDMPEKQAQCGQWLQQVMRDLTVYQTLPNARLYFPKLTGFYDALSAKYPLTTRIALAEQVLQSDYTLGVAISWHTRLEKIVLDCWHVLETL